MIRSPRLIAALCAVGAVLAALLLANHWRLEATQARAEAAAAVSAQQLAEKTTQVVERYHERETVIRETAAPAIQAIEESPGAETPLPDDLRSNWLNGINSLRDKTTGADNDPKPAE